MFDATFHIGTLIAVGLATQLSSTMTLRQLAVLLCVAFVPSVSRAQLLPAPPSTLPLFDRDSIQPGLRVRLFVRGVAYQRSGTVRTLSDSVMLFEGDRYRELIRVPLRQMDWMQVSTDRRVSLTRVLYGASLGMLVGLGVERMRELNSQDCGHGPAFSCSTSGFLLGASIGAVGGAVIGYSFPAERWRSVRLR